jgi:hypothetical protein
MTKDNLLLRSASQVRKVKNVKIKHNPDSVYKEIKVRNKSNHEVDTKKIPKRLLSSLPFESQPKIVEDVVGLTKDVDIIDKNSPMNSLTNAILSDKEKKRLNILNRMKTIHDERLKIQTIAENKKIMKDLKKNVKEERSSKKRERKVRSEKYIKRETKRIKLSTN